MSFLIWLRLQNPHRDPLLSTAPHTIEGYQITKEQKLRMNTVRSHLTYIENSIKYLDDSIDSMVTPYESLIALMRTYSRY